MGILRDVIWILYVVLALYCLLNPRNRRILVRTHIHDIVVALVLHWATCVVSLDSGVAVFKVVARTSLVAKTPYHNRRTVDSSVNHLHIACYMCVAELLNVRQRFFAIVIFVALDVGLILKIDAILIA